MTQIPLPKLYVEISEALHTDLADLVREQRESGASWRGIANDVRERTGITVSHEALRTWTLGRPPVAAART